MRADALASVGVRERASRIRTVRYQSAGDCGSACVLLSTLLSDRESQPRTRQRGSGAALGLVSGLGLPPRLTYDAVNGLGCREELFVSAEASGQL